MKAFQLIIAKMNPQKKEGETTLRYIFRLEFIMTIFFCVIMVPVYVIAADIEKKPIIEYILRNGLPSYIGLFVIGPIVIFFKGERLKQEKNTKKEKRN
jgi:hypothetical protein